jgi:hypothetical protein
MLINTGLSATAVGTGTTSLWSSDSVAGLTNAINSFISGASSVSFWVMGKYAEGTDKYVMSDVALTSNTAINSVFDSNLPAYVDTANNDAGFAAATNPWLANIPNTSAIHYTESNLYGNSVVGGIPLGASADFIRSGYGFFSGLTQTTLESWNLSANGALTYGAVSAVPVPAAVWLFGSGLMGLVGVARRRKV